MYGVKSVHKVFLYGDIGPKSKDRHSAFFQFHFNIRLFFQFHLRDFSRFTSNDSLPRWVTSFSIPLFDKLEFVEERYRATFINCVHHKIIICEKL